MNIAVLSVKPTCLRLPHCSCYPKEDALQNPFCGLVSADIPYLAWVSNAAIYGDSNIRVYPMNAAGGLLNPTTYVACVLRNAFCMLNCELLVRLFALQTVRGARWLRAAGATMGQACPA